MNHRYRLLVFSIFFLFSSVVILNLQLREVYGSVTWMFMLGQSFWKVSDLFFSISLVFVAFWSLSAKSYQLLYLWVSLFALTCLHFCLINLIPFYWVSMNVQVYRQSAIGLFGSMLFIGVSAHLLHLLISQKKTEQDAAANP